MIRRIAALRIIARSAPSPSSPAPSARRYSARGLTARRSRAIRRPFHKCTFVMLAEIDFKRSSDNDRWVEYWFSHRGLDLDTLDAPEQPALRRRPRCYFCRALLISRRGPLLLRHFLQPYCIEAYRRMMMLLSVRQTGASRVALPIQHLLNFLPEPQGQGSLRPAGSLMMTSATAARQRLRQLA